MDCSLSAGGWFASIQTFAAAVTAGAAVMTLLVYRRIEALQGRMNAISERQANESKLNREAALRPLVVIQWSGAAGRHSLSLINHGVGEGYEFTIEGHPECAWLPESLPSGKSASGGLTFPNGECPPDPGDLRVVVIYRDVLGNWFRSVCHKRTVLFEPLQGQVASA